MGLMKSALRQSINVQYTNTCFVMEKKIVQMAEMKPLLSVKTRSLIIDGMKFIVSILTFRFLASRSKSFCKMLVMINSF